MKKLSLILLLLCISYPANAVNFLTLMGVGTGATYTGPGDIVASAYGWYGLRAYSAATRGNAAVNACNIGDAACANLSTDVTTGNLIVGTIGGAACSVSIVSGTYVSATGAVTLATGTSPSLTSANVFATTALTGTGSFIALQGKQTATTGTTGTTVNFTAATGLGTITITGGTVSVCTIKTAYDQSGNSRDMANSTVATRPILAINAIGSLPAMAFDTTATLAGAFTTQSRPFSMSTVNYESTAQAAAGGQLGSLLNISAAFAYGQVVGGANTRVAYDAGTQTLAATAANNAWHTVQTVFNGASSVVTVDGSDTSGTLSTAAITGTISAVLGADTIGDVGGSFTGELGWWPGGFSSGNRTSLNSNQRAYWGF